MLRIALRQGRAGFIAATAIAGFNGIAQSLAYDAIAGDTPASRAAFAAQIELLGRQLTFLLPIPVQIETLAGFLDWRHFGALPLMYGVWALLASTGATRGDEDRGYVEQWLAAGVSRARYLRARVGGFAILASSSVAVSVAAAMAGAALSGETLPPGAAAAQGVALVALTLCCFAIGLLVSQLAVTRRGAAGLVALVLGILFLVAGGARSGALGTVAQASPFWQYERSRPLLAGGSLDAPSLIWLGSIALLATAAAAVLFRRRDLGASAIRPRIRRARPSRVPAGRATLRAPVLRALDRQATGLLSWAAGLALLAFFLGSILPTMIRVAKEVPLIQLMVLRGAVGDLEGAFVGSVWGNTALLVLSSFAIAQVSGWAADESEGRLEMTLATPLPRWRVVLERAVALAAGAVVVVAVASLTLAVVTRSHGIPLDLLEFAGASALLVPLVVAFGAIGAVLIGWRPRAAVWILGVVAVASYFIQQLAPMFRFPDLVRNLSLFELYGSPLLLGPNWAGLGAQLAIIIGGFGLAAISLSRRDISR